MRAHDMKELGSGVARCAVVLAAAIAASACGQIAEPTKTADADDTRPSGPVLAGPAEAPDASAAPDPTLRCSDALPRPTTTSTGDAASPTSFIRWSDGSTTMHQPYEIGAFAGADAARTCGDRGVHFADRGCGGVALSACEGATCVYVATNTQLRPDERKTSPAGHYVDPTGRCWSLVDAAFSFDDDAGAVELGGSRSGSVTLTVVSGADRTMLTLTFVACVTERYDGTCR